MTERTELPVTVVPTVDEDPVLLLDRTPGHAAVFATPRALAVLGLQTTDPALCLAVPVGERGRVDDAGAFRVAIASVPAEMVPGVPVEFFHPLPWFGMPVASTFLLARLWRQGSVLPCLDLRPGPHGELAIAILGLEHAKNQGQIHSLVKLLPALRRIVAGGRPPGLRPGWRELVEKAERLKRDNPGLSWEQIAGRVGVTERTLRNWRKQLA